MKKWMVLIGGLLAGVLCYYRKEVKILLGK